MKILQFLISTTIGVSEFFFTKQSPSLIVTPFTFEPIFSYSINRLLIAVKPNKNHKTVPFPTDGHRVCMKKDSKGVQNGFERRGVTSKDRD